VTVNGFDAAVGDVLMARVNNEIRGKAPLVDLAPHPGVGRTFSVQSRPDEIIEFQLWRNSTQTIMLSTLQLPTAPGSSYGTAVNPLIINFTIQTLTISGSATLNANPLSGIDVMPMYSDPEYRSFYTSLRTNSAGRYAVPGITFGSNIMIIATSPLYFFEPPNYSYPYLTTNRTANFVAGAHPTIPVSGRITWNGEGVPAVNVWGTSTTNATGHYSFQLVQNGTTTITPTKPGWSFTPATHTVSFITSPQTVNFTGSPQLFTISGNTGEPLTTVNYTSDFSGSGSVTSNASGVYSIPDMAFGDNIVLTPYKTGFTYSPASSTVTNITANTTRNFTATQINYSISITITDAGSPLPGVQLYNGSTLISTTYSAGVYTFSLPHGSSMTITPILDGFNFSPISETITSISSATAITFFATAVPRHTVQATVLRNSVGFSGVSIVYSVAGGVSGSILTDASGIASIELNQTTANITFTPTMTGYNMSPTSRTLNGLSGDDNISFNATIQTFSITGNAGTAGVTITVSGDHTATVTADAAGNFTIPGVPYGSDIVITPTLPGWTFSPTSVNVNNVTDHTNLDDIFTATPITHRVTVYCEDWDDLPIAGVIVNYGGATTGLTNSFGIFEFEAIWGSNINISVSKSGHVFDVSMAQIIDITDDETRNFKSRQPIVFNLSGRITLSNLVPLPGVTVVAGPNSAITDANGEYDIDIYESDNFLVLPTLTGFQFFPAAYHITYVDDNIVDSDFVATIAEYIVSGIALKNGLPFSDVLFTLNSGDTITTAIDGEFEFEIQHGSSVNIVPSKAGYTFTPAAFNLTTLLGPISNIVFNAIVDSFLVSGYVLLNGDPGFPVQDVKIVDEISGRFVYSGADGRYFFYAYYEDNISLVAEKEWFTFTPDQIEIDHIMSAQPGNNFIAAGICADVVFTVHGAIYNPLGVYLTPITIELSSATDGADIYFTIDGTIPTPATGTLYTTPISIGYSSGRYITARAFRPPLYSPSAIATGLFRVTGYVRKPTISLASGQFATAKTVFITPVDGGEIFYTLDGSIPTHLSEAYSDSLLINKNSILRAISYKPDYAVHADSIATATYQIHHEMRFDFPETLFMTAEHGAFINIELINYLEDSVAGEHDYVISILNTPINLTTSIEPPFITITPRAGWDGTERIGFKLEYIPRILPGMLPVPPRYNVAIDSLTVQVNPSHSLPRIIGFFPETSFVEVPWNVDFSFFVNVSSPIPITYTWLINGVDIENDNNVMTSKFLDLYGTFVKIIVSATGFNWEYEWFVDIHTSDTDETIAINTTRLAGNYPNPFNPETVIRFIVGTMPTSLQWKSETSATNPHVQIDIFNIRGQLVRSLVDSEFAPGEHNVVWNGTDDTGRSVGSGIYFYRMKAEGFTETKKMILLK
jgi:hypothetical protein